jgi:hypothetical protein
MVWNHISKWKEVSQNQFCDALRPSSYLGKSLFIFFWQDKSLFSSLDDRKIGCLPLSVDTQYDDPVHRSLWLGQVTDHHRTYKVTRFTETLSLAKLLFLAHLTNWLSPRMASTYLSFYMIWCLRSTDLMCTTVLVLPLFHIKSQIKIYTSHHIET